MSKVVWLILRQILCYYTAIQMIHKKTLPSKHSSWWRRLEDVFHLRLQKTSSRRLPDVLISRRIYSPYSYVFRRCLQDVFKTSWSRPIYSSWPYVFKTSLRRFQNVFKTTSRRFQDVFKTFCKNVSKTFEDVWRLAWFHCFVFHFTTSFSSCLQRRF